ncbi:MAG: ATP-binding protein [Pseudomonadota bacterium]
MHRLRHAGLIGHWGVNKKLSAIVATTALLLFSIIAVVDWIRIRQSVENDFLKEAIATAQGLEAALASGIQIVENDTAFSVMQKFLLNHAELTSVSLAEPYRDVLTVTLSSVSPSHGQPASTLSTKAYQTGQDQYEIEEKFSGNGTLTIAIPAVIARAPRGAIEMEFTLEQVARNTKAKFLSDIVFLFAFVTVLSSVLYVAVLRIVISPARKLKDQISHFAETGDIPASIVANEDELGELGREFQNMAARLLEAQEKQNQLSRLQAIGQLTGGVAHDFNNLLAIIRGNAELLQFEAKDPIAIDMLKEIDRATLRGKDLTSSLLSHARKQPLFPKVFDISDSCKQMAGMLERTLGPSIRIDWHVASHRLAYADQSQFETVLLNLSLNARDAMPGGGILMIETLDVSGEVFFPDPNISRPHREYVMLRVRDSGSGMSPMVVKHAVEPFFTTKETGAGSGLGLAMVNGFAQQSGGWFEIDSEVGQGTTISFYLPKATTEMVEVRAKKVNKQRLYAPGKTILVVEDERDLMQIIARHLEGHGNTVLQAHNGPVALEILASFPHIDLVLSDVVLPDGVNGIEICRQALASSSKLNCILMSGNVDAAGSDLPNNVTLLEKPFSLSELSSVLAGIWQAQ